VGDEGNEVEETEVVEGAEPGNVEETLPDGGRVVPLADEEEENEDEEDEDAGGALQTLLLRQLSTAGVRMSA
jgi:hypothetical protein